ncbi:MAG: hypothetical protein KJ023_08765 [Burkholderiaceae bacterium]|nr:hypothetical protein [Burkholderiaceae bacterium]
MNDTTNLPAAPPSEDAGELLKLSDWLTFEQILERYGEHYRKPDSLRWALRVHRPHLLRRGALCHVGGRVLIHPERFESAVIEGGIEAATSRAAA